MYIKEINKKREIEEKEVNVRSNSSRPTSFHYFLIERCSEVHQLGYHCFCMLIGNYVW